MQGVTADPARTMRDLFGPEALGAGGDDSQSNAIAAPNPPEDQDQTDPLDQLTGLMAALYGSDFPLIRAVNQFAAMAPDNVMEQGMQPNTMPPLPYLLAQCDPGDWVSWVRGRWNLHRAAVDMHLWLITRNRLFRSGQQWVSSRGVGGSWREPNRPAESARVTHNLIGPALDQRCQVVADQRPGFQVEPTSMSPEEKRKAEGRQKGLEYQFDQQNMPAQTREAEYWAQTDGVAFWETYWDRDAGPWDERMGTPDQKKPLGDLRTKTRRVEQVRVSANATASEAPYYVIVRDVIAATESAQRYGVSGTQSQATTDGGRGNDNAQGNDGMLPSWVLSQTVVGEGNRLRNQDTVERFTLYVDRHPDVLPDGLQIVTVGNAVIWGPGELLFGCIPITPVRDGSTDPSYYPRPIMEHWIPPQQRINAALSLWVNSVRVNSGGRFLAKPDAISRETFIGSGLSLIEVECSGPLGDTIQPVNGFLVGQDVKDLIAFDVKAFEDMSGFNDVSRGQISSETATAVATANEQLQRVFAPPVEAAATAFQQWAEVNIAGMAWGYDLPRDIGAVGSDRPDLGRALSSKDFDGPSTVKVEAAKMMPMPAYYRKSILDDLLAKGVITRQQYMRNSMFGNVSNLETPDEDQESRAKRVADAIRSGTAFDKLPPLRWQTNEAIEQDVLEREIILRDDLPPEMIDVASQRWKQDAAQAQQKQGAPQPGTPDATYQQFVSDTVSKVIAASTAFVAKEVAGQDGMTPPSGQPAADGSAPMGGAPPIQQPMAPQQPPVQDQIQLEQVKHQHALELAQQQAALAPPPVAAQHGIIVPPPDLSEIAATLQAVQQTQATMAQILAELVNKDTTPVIMHHESQPAIVQVHPTPSPAIHIAAPAVNVPAQPAPVVHVAAPEAKKGPRKGTITGPDGKTYTVESE
jgi:hypothetical protein